ncbi:RNA polymerase sigma-70 factor [Chitinophaga barathri]|uniref:RNA polymerase sigma-70 factor n=2 Tax=Chitinophaga barathri TaxID=1647451 RepID=A0A3N4N117_9BACT|nr:RNA polymerase sigma-70 factor [Chitinophaga barathri]
MYSGEELDMCLRQIAAAGCQQSYRRLFHWFYKPLKQFALAIVKSPEQAEEIAADVLVNIWRNRGQLPGIDNIRVYLYVSARNISLNYLKQQHRQATLSLDDVSVSMGPLAMDPEQLFISAELVNRVRSAIDQLPPRCKLIFKLIREDGLKYKEVASILDISVNTIDNQMAIAFKKISQAIHLDMTRRPVPRTEG